ncbi:amidohydrolase family protein [Duganella sp. FT135W]|uniref:Amidohydrolase family protein n=1 Tax=Duganella flavida TaxID=2692175 RepID=A0A6L8K3U0_9BURK|nr:amidohydrolase family protein [Duganella flavida]MYM22179.1 amidohydrolase family protein [Duganella flavida]
MKTSTSPYAAMLALACLAIPCHADSGPACYDRLTQPHLAIVDSHLHFRPFGGSPILHQDLTRMLKNAGVLYANVFGIGQTLPYDSACTYYLNCPGTPVMPNLKNDIINAQNVTELPVQVPKLTMSMSFADLAKPATVKPGMSVLDQEFPGLFKWMGELNLVKQALFANGHRPVTLEEIRGWGPFMAALRERNMPIGLHGDLGDNDQPTKYLNLITEVVNLYPDNKVVWLHMGLSKELTDIDPDKHIKLLSNLLDKHPNMMIDLSWRVIADSYFFKPAIRAKYIPFINKYSKRILPGTDFVASDDKTFDSYLEELTVTSYIYQFVDDEAFRNIALGQNYFDMLRLQDKAPVVCGSRQVKQL